MSDNKSNNIEQFIKTLLNEDSNPSIELARNDLANYFSCSPSQINYVLQTRFNVEKGYVIESKRGGGGCITIFKISSDPAETIPSILKAMEQERDISYQRACDYLDRLLREDLITEEEETIIRSAISDKALALPVRIIGLRKQVFKEILVGLMRR